MLFETLETKDLTEVSFVLDIEINRDRSTYWVYIRRPTLIVYLKDVIWMAFHLVMLLML